MKYEDTFGYWPSWESLEFARGVIYPLPDFLESKKAVKAVTHSDGCVYPPTIYQEGEPICGRPAPLHKLPATHVIALRNASADKQKTRTGVAGFIIHFLGLVYGGRHQFGDWWFDGRVRVEDDLEQLMPRREQVASCIDKAVHEWSSWPVEQRRSAINVLHLFGRAAVHERESDRFEAEYLIADSVYALARDTGKLSISRLRRDPTPHAKRLNLLCKELGLARDARHVRSLVALRNPLLHQALWDKGTPGTPRGDTSFYAAYWLHRLSRRALLSVLGLKGSFLRSPWWMMGVPFFDVTGAG